MGFACGSTDCDKWAEDLTDPDITGFGVLLSFIFPTLASHVLIFLAYITRSIHKDQYSQLDAMILARLERNNSPTLASLRNTRHLQLVLALSDQLLVTGVGLLVAVYTQLCSASLFSFKAGVGLAFLSSGVHMDCLVALGAHFDQHRRQARIRIGLILFLALFLLVSELLTYITWDNRPGEVAACALREPRPAGVALQILTWAAVWYWVLDGYCKAIMHLRSSGSEFRATYATVLGLARLLFRGAGARRELDALERRERRAVRREYDDGRRALETRRMGPWRTLGVAAPAILDDVSRSLAWAIWYNLTFTGYMLIAELVFLFGGDVDVSPLFEPKFGQVMPLLLLFVFMFNVIEASAGKTADSWTQTRLTAAAVGSTQTPPRGSLRPGCGDASGAEENPPRVPVSRTAPAAPGEHAATGFQEPLSAGARSSTFGAVVRRATVDVRGSESSSGRRPGSPPGVDRVSGGPIAGPSNRANTLRMEAGDQSFEEEADADDVDEDSDDGDGEEEKQYARMALSAAAYRKVPRFAKAFVCAAFAAHGVFVCALLLRYRETILTYLAINFLFHAVPTFLAFRRLWRARAERRAAKERRRRRRRTESIQMVSVPGRES